MSEGPKLEAPKTPLVQMHMACLVPWASCVDNQTIVRWMSETGADALEWIPLGRGPLGPTSEVLSKPVSALEAIFGSTLGSGHVIFNPYASMWNILGRRPDPLRPGEPIALYNILLSGSAQAQEALHKLEAVRRKQGGTLLVVVYPPLQGKDIYGTYERPLLQTHPSVFDDERTADELIKAVRDGKYDGICLDTYHFQEASSSGARPFGADEAALFRSIEKLQRAGVLKEVHVQPGRILHMDQTIESVDELRAMFGENPSYKTQLGRMLKFLIHDLGFMGPFTFEVDPRALVGVYGKKVLLPPDVGNITDALGSAVDYVRRT